MVGNLQCMSLLRYYLRPLPKEKRYEKDIKKFPENWHEELNYVVSWSKNLSSNNPSFLTPTFLKKWKSNIYDLNLHGGGKDQMKQSSSYNEQR